MVNSNKIDSEGVLKTIKNDHAKKLMQTWKINSKYE